jgi:putative ABC transport system substrate-binding protein
MISTLPKAERMERVVRLEGNLPMITRRALVGLAGGAISVAMGPNPLRAQLREALPRIAVLSDRISNRELLIASGTVDLPEQSSLTFNWSVFFAELARLGYASLTSAQLHLWTTWNLDEMGGPGVLIAALLAREPDIIVTDAWWLVPEIIPAARGTPIVTVVPDPVALGLTTSIARPDRNVTGGTNGVSPDISAKQVQLLAEATASDRVAVVIVDSIFSLPASVHYQDAVAELVRGGTEVIPLPVPNPPSAAAADIETWLERVIELVTGRGFSTALLVDVGGFEVDPAMTARLMRGAGLATACGSGLPYVSAGGLIGYGPNFDETILGLADYVDRILKGASAADLPFFEPRKFDLAINGRTAQTLGLTIPEHLRLLATEIVE